MTLTVVTAFIGLGSNLGDRPAHLDLGFTGLERLEATTLLHQSSIHETQPVGPVTQGLYLNAVAAIETTLTARELLDHLMRIESEAGRDRQEEQRWGPRTLDLDLLLYGDAVITQEGLTVPHPRMHLRHFVLGPLCELAPDLSHPVLRQTMRGLLESLDSCP